MSDWWILRTTFLGSILSPALCHFENSPCLATTKDGSGSEVRRQLNQNQKVWGFKGKFSGNGGDLKKVYKNYAYCFWKRSAQEKHKCGEKFASPKKGSLRFFQNLLIFFKKLFSAKIFIPHKLMLTTTRVHGFNLSDWVIDRGSEWLGDRLSDEWVNERKWVSKWIVLFEKKKTNNCFLTFLFIKKTTQTWNFETNMFRFGTASSIVVRSLTTCSALGCKRNEIAIFLFSEWLIYGISQCLPSTTMEVFLFYMYCGTY